MNQAELLRLGATLLSRHSLDAVAWAAEVLHSASQLTAFIPEVEAVIRAAREPEERADCKAHFYQVRALVLALETEATPDRASLGLLLLAENVAKLAYNFTRPACPFDRDAGHWIPVCACDVLREAPDSEERDRLAALFAL